MMLCEFSPPLRMPLRVYMHLKLLLRLWRIYVQLSAWPTILQYHACT